MAKIYTKTVKEVNKACIKTIESIKAYGELETERAITHIMNLKPFFFWNKNKTREQAIEKLNCNWWTESFYHELRIAEKLKMVTDNENCAAVVLTEREFEIIF